MDNNSIIDDGSTISKDPETSATCRDDENMSSSQVTGKNADRRWRQGQALSVWHGNIGSPSSLIPPNEEKRRLAAVHGKLLGNGRLRDDKKSEARDRDLPPAETSSEPSTSSSPLVTTPHSSPRTKRPRKSYPPELSAITYLSLGRNRLVPLPSPGGYSDSVVERRLSYVEMQKRRDLTPRSRIFLQLYETTAAMLLAEADPQKRRSHQKSLQQYDDFLDKNQDILIANTKVEREIEESLL